MRRRTAVSGLLAIAAMVAAALAFLSGGANQPPPGAAGGASASGETWYIPCASCDARHQRLANDPPGND